MSYDFPNSPTSGQTVTGSTGVSYRWDGTKWAATGGVGGVTVSDTPPATPNVGDMWFDSLGTQLYLRYNDGNTTQWVPATNQTGGVGEAASDGYQYARRNAAWSRVATPDVGRNLIHNAGFTVAQRGAGPWTAAGNYTADRWVVQDVTDAVSFTVAGISDVGRGQIGDESAVRCLQNTFTGNAAAGAYNAIEQRIEGVRRLAGQTVTVSFWAIAGVGGVKLGLNMYQVFGTGGSPSAPVTVLATGNAATLTAAWARYSFTIAVPSVSGKTFGTNNDDTTYLRFFYSSGTTNNAQAGNIGVQAGTVQMWGVQLEIGSVATPLEKRDPEQELRQCQRFYQVVTGSFRWTVSGVQTMWAPSQWPQMRATPTASLNTAGSRALVSGVALTPTAPYGGYLGCASTGAGDAYIGGDLWNLSADL